MGKKNNRNQPDNGRDRMEDQDNWNNDPQNQFYDEIGRKGGEPPAHDGDFYSDQYQRNNQTEFENENSEIFSELGQKGGEAPSDFENRNRNRDLFEKDTNEWDENDKL